MGIYFGTDGIRGVVNDSLTFDLAYKCGNALCAIKCRPQVIIGRDSRITGEFLTLAVSGGIMAGGGDVIDIGVCSTPGIAYITKLLNANFGVVISASHNPAEHNGIKIFDSNGVKLGDKKEEDLERRFIHQINLPSNEIGRYTQKFNLVNRYIDYLCACSDLSLKGLKIILDGSNGATYKIAPKVFKKLGATVIATNCRNDGANINRKCGSLYPENLAKNVIKYGGNIGFAFDGDGDRIIAVDEKGNVIDGDNIIYILAKQFKKENKLLKDIVVGTRHTNMAIELKLKEEGIDLVRADIGDKYVCAKMEDLTLSLGGEKSGHIIIKDFLMTGDGVLAGIKLAEILSRSKKSISEINDVILFPQTNIDCVVEDKVRIINSEKLSKIVDEEEKRLGNGYRIMVRVSGTENKIRIMVEGKDRDKTLKSASEIKRVVEEININR